MCLRVRRCKSLGSSILNLSTPTRLSTTTTGLYSIHRKLIATRATKANSRSNAVNLSLAGTPLLERTFLIGTLTARNSTGQVNPTNVPEPTTNSGTGDRGRSGQPPAMIALYVIMGCISAMFALMIGMAARRAIRNPERYGRREGNENEAAQTRAGGIAQALLDTFPVIKFNRRESPKSLHSDTEIEFRQLPHTDQQHDRRRSSTAHGHGYIKDQALHSAVFPNGMSGRRSVADTMSLAPPIRDDDDISVKSVEKGYTDSELHLPGAKADPSTAMADLEGDQEEQCPICLIEFEEGDDVRVLPCEKEHVYHKTCIDPWLLDVSSSCPHNIFAQILTTDFNVADTAATTTETTQPTASGFAKYLAFMRREKRGGRSRAGTSASHASGSGSTGREHPGPPV
jgi:hypothetical protein